MGLDLGKYNRIADEARRLASAQKLRVSVAGADDDDVLSAVRICMEEFGVEATLFGKGSTVEKLAAQVGLDVSTVEIVDAPSQGAAAQMAVSFVSSGKAHILMKGQVKTADFMKAVLNAETGLRTGRTLSHVAFFDVPSYDRLLCVTDGGVNVSPDFKTKVDIIQNAIEAARALGISLPKVALLAAVETVNPDMACTTEAAALSKMADRGQIKGAVVDGPLSLDVAISKEAARQKGVSGGVAGAADVLVVPDIESGNILGKSMLYFGGAVMAGVVAGARRPIVLNSRADTAKNKAASLAVAMLMSR